MNISSVVYGDTIKCCKYNSKKYAPIFLFEIDKINKLYLSLEMNDLNGLYNKVLPQLKT